MASAGRAPRWSRLCAWARLAAHPPQLPAWPCPSDHRPSSHLQGGIVLSSDIRVPSTKDPECLIWLRASTLGRQGYQGRSWGDRAACPMSLSSPHPPLLLLLTVSLWFSGAGPSVLTGPQQTALACRRLRFSWTQLRPGAGLPAGDCDAPSPLCLQSHPRVSHAAGAFSGGSFVTASPASARGWLPSSRPPRVGGFLALAPLSSAASGACLETPLGPRGQGRDDAVLRSPAPPVGALLVAASRPAVGESTRTPSCRGWGPAGPSWRDRVAAAWVPGPRSEAGGGAGGVCAAGSGLWSLCWPGWGSRSEPASRWIPWGRLRVAAGGPLSTVSGVRASRGAVSLGWCSSQGAGVELLFVFLFSGRTVAFQYCFGFCPT